MYFYNDKKSYNNLRVLLKRKFRKSILKYLKSFIIGKFPASSNASGLGIGWGKKKLRKIAKIKRYLFLFSRAKPKKKIKLNKKIKKLLKNK